MRISYIASVTVEHDAISGAVRDEVSWLRDAGHDVLLFTYERDFADIPSHEVQKISDVVFNGHFQNSDLVVFHFGVYSDLFDAILLCPERARRLVVFHNITPPAVASPAERALLQKSLDQLPNTEFADAVFCVSEVNQAVLRDVGIRKPSLVLPIAVHFRGPAPTSKPSHQDGIVRAAYVGRFVQSKGILDLLAALRIAEEMTTMPKLEVSFLGSSKFSDPVVLGAVHEMATVSSQDVGKVVSLNVVTDASEDVKWELLGAADLLVLPSYHEGLGVPVLEALAMGCRVVAYNNSAVPFTSGGMSRLVPTGDVQALAEALRDEAELVRSWEWRSSGYANWATSARDHANGFEVEQTRERFLQAIASLVADELPPAIV